MQDSDHFAQAQCGISQQPGITNQHSWATHLRPGATLLQSGATNPQPTQVPPITAHTFASRYAPRFQQSQQTQQPQQPQHQQPMPLQDCGIAHFTNLCQRFEQDKEEFRILMHHQVDHMERLFERFDLLNEMAEIFVAQTVNGNSPTIRQAENVVRMERVEQMRQRMQNRQLQQQQQNGLNQQPQNQNISQLEQKLQQIQHQIQQLQHQLHQQQSQNNNSNVSHNYDHDDYSPNFVPPPNVTQRFTPIPVSLIPIQQQQNQLPQQQQFQQLQQQGVARTLLQPMQPQQNQSQENQPQQNQPQQNQLQQNQLQQNQPQQNQVQAQIQQQAQTHTQAQVEAIAQVQSQAQSPLNSPSTRLPIQAETFPTVLIGTHRPNVDVSIRTTQPTCPQQQQQQQPALNQSLQNLRFLSQSTGSQNLSPISCQIPTKLQQTVHPFQQVTTRAQVSSDNSALMNPSPNHHLVGSSYTQSAPEFSSSVSTTAPVPNLSLDQSSVVPEDQNPTVRDEEVENPNVNPEYFQSEPGSSSDAQNSASQHEFVDSSTQYVNEEEDVEFCDCTKCLNKVAAMQNQNAEMVEHEKDAASESDSDDSVQFLEEVEIRFSNQNYPAPNLDRNEMPPLKRLKA